MFEIRYDNGSGPVTFTVSPAPTAVEYPTKRIVNARKSVDNNSIIQRPIVDSRPRKWIWDDGYKDSFIGYSNLWAVLQNLDAKTRLDNGWNVLVEIKDNVSGKGGFDTFTFVKVVQVDRTPRASSGIVMYDDTFIEFLVEDASYLDF